MEKDKVSEIIPKLVGLKLYEWKSIENAVNREFTEMSNRLELKDASRIQREVES